MVGTSDVGIGYILSYYTLPSKKFQVPVNSEAIRRQLNASPDREGGRTTGKGLSTAHNRTENGKTLPGGIFWVGGSLVKIQREREATPQKGGGKRGVIKGFSRQSRRRLMQTVGKIDRLSKPLFLGLTFPDELNKEAGDPQKKVEYAKVCLRRFEKRFLRRFPSGSYIWRLEGQKRKSGRFLGQWFLPTRPRLRCSRFWGWEL